MDLNSQLPILYISLYLVLIYIILKYKYKNFKKIYKDEIIDLKKFEPTMILYIKNELSVKELFYTTFLKLNYSKNKNKLSYEEIVNDYITEKTNKKLNLEELDEIVNTDLGFAQVLAKFFNNLKKDTREAIGKVDFMSENILVLLISVPYFMIVVYSIYNGFTLFHLILISLALSLISLLIISKLSYRHLTVKYFLSSLLLAFISSYFWIKYSNLNYIAFHLILGCLSFMYPVFLKIVKFAIKTNTYFSNDLQSKIIMELVRIDKLD